MRKDARALSNTVTCAISIPRATAQWRLEVNGKLIGEYLHARMYAQINGQVKNIMYGGP